VGPHTNLRSYYDLLGHIISSKVGPTQIGHCYTLTVLTPTLPYILPFIMIPRQRRSTISASPFKPGFPPQLHMIPSPPIPPSPIRKQPDRIPKALPNFSGPEELHSGEPGAFPEGKRLTHRLREAISSPTEHSIVIPGGVREPDGVFPTELPQKLPVQSHLWINIASPLENGTKSLLMSQATLRGYFTPGFGVGTVSTGLTPVLIWTPAEVLIPTL
jgi:hypothetical protein